MTKNAYDKIASGLTEALEHVNNMPLTIDGVHEKAMLAARHCFYDYFDMVRDEVSIVVRSNRRYEAAEMIFRAFVGELGKARVRKKSGSEWHGRIVGFYSTSLTPIGYAVESEREPGSVQIYPASALEVIPDDR